MSSLIFKIRKLKKENISGVINNRVKDFINFKRTNNNLFLELSFCVLTANYNAAKAIEIQEKIGLGFISLSLNQLSSKLKDLGYRYPNLRAEYIVYNRQFLYKLKSILEAFKDKNDLRDFFAENIKGLSYKESSHFLRNIGYAKYAIIDFHIIDLLIKEGYLKEKPKTLDRLTYLEIERILEGIGKEVDLSLSELDLYLWYLETGTVLK